MAGLTSPVPASSGPDPSVAGSIRRRPAARSLTRLGFQSGGQPADRSVAGLQGALRLAVLLPFTAALLFVACAVASVPRLSRPVGEFVRSHQNAAVGGLGPALYGLAGLAAYLTLLALLRLGDTLVRRLRKTSPAAEQTAKPMELILEETAVQLGAGRAAGIRERHADTPVQIPIPEPTSAQRKALHAAALVTIGSRSLRSMQGSGTQRRDSDYEGPRRRATDNKAEPVYEGPFRRASDRSRDTIPIGVSASPSGQNAGVDANETKERDSRFAPLCEKMCEKSAAETGVKPGSAG